MRENKLFGIMSAMQEEIESILGIMDIHEKLVIADRHYCIGKIGNADIVTVFSRWGKVASAITATTLIHKFRVKEIIFTGVAGSVDKQIDIGDVIIGKNLYQHDIDASPFFEPYIIPLMGIDAINTSEDQIQKMSVAAKNFVYYMEDDLRFILETDFNIHSPKIHVGDIASGDKFLSCSKAVNLIKQGLPSIKCVEMEGASVAQVCYEHSIPFVVVRTISDTANPEAPIDIMRFINSVAGKYSAGIILMYLKQCFGQFLEINKAQKYNPLK